MEIKGKKILVVEDDVLINSNLVEFLQIQEAKVQFCLNGLQALEIFPEFKPDLILCDILMPVMDGFEFLKELNLRFPTHQTLFIFVTSKSDIGNIRMGMNLGADDYIIKPFLLNDLLETIRKKFEKYRYRMEGLEKVLEEIERKTEPTPYQEFNTCLNGILTGSLLLLNDPKICDNIETKSILNVIQMSSFRLYRGINNLVLLNDVKTLKVLPFLKSLNFAFIESSIMQIAQNYDRAEDIILEFNPDSGEFKSDKFLIKKLLDELSDNSLKYTRKGEKIHWNLKVTNLEVQIFLTYNTGDFDEFMFSEVDAFKQFSKEKNTVTGLGLGLYLSKNIVEILSGTFSFQKLGSKGQFRIELKQK